MIVPGQDGAPRAVEVDRELTVGRAADCDVVLADPSVSSRHVSVSPAPDGIAVRDLGSTNGTFINGQRVTQPAVARPGDELRLGQAIITIEGDVAASPGTIVVPAGGTVVATVPAFPDVAPAPPPVWRLVVRAGVDIRKEVTLAEGEEVVVGRAGDSALVLTDPRASSQHARILRAPEGLLVTDLGSANGTLVRGTRIQGSTTAHPGDEIQLGETVVVAFVGDAAPDAYAPTPTIIEPGPSGGLAAAEVEAIVRKRSRRTMLAVVAVGVVAVTVAVVAAVLVLGGGDEQETVPAVVSKNGDATVQIINVTDGGLVFRGSGSVIDREEGLILTNNHVASGGKLFVFSKDLEDEIEAELVAAAVCEDLALIRIKDPDDREQFGQVELAKAGTLNQGDLVVALGYPGTAEGASGERPESLTVTSGVVSKVDVSYDVPGSGLPLLTSVIQHQAAVNPGNSGGPLFDSKGRQVGVNTAIFFGSSGRVEGANYAVTVGRVRELLDDMKKGISPGWFGAGFEESAVVDGFETGLYVLGVTPGSAAEELGFTGAIEDRSGYLVYPFEIIEVDGEPIGTLADYCEALPSKPGPVELTVYDLEADEDVVVEVYIGKR